MIKLETPRLILRGFTLDDVGDLYHYAKNPDVGPNAGWKMHESLEESEKIVKMFIEDNDVWAIVLKETGHVVGSIGLHEDGFRKFSNCREVGYVLSHDYWGQGLMVEAVKRVIKYAFEEAGITLLSVYHYPFNQRSKRVVEKCGFHYEGTLRSAAMIYNKTIYDKVCYSMTYEEYHQLKEVQFR